MTFHLSSDIIDCILVSLPDLATLLSTILVSKSFYQVFQAHPGSTLISVAATQIGPEVLPYALRLAHFNRGEYLASRATYVQEFPPESKFSHTEALAATSYVEALARNDRAVRELELFFSITCKDRTSGSRSLLNPRESLKFRRAFYRWWLSASLFPPCYLRSTQVTLVINDDEAEDDGESNYDTDSDTEDDTDDGTDDDTDDDTDEDSDNDAQNVYLTKSHDLRNTFLSEFSDDEVVEMWLIYSFMVFVSVRVRNATSEPAMPDYLLLWSGPSTVAEVLRSLRSFEKPEGRLAEQLIWDYGHTDPIWPGFSEYLEGKDYDISKVKVDTWDPILGSDVILDSAAEANEECEECHVVDFGTRMWSSSNLHLLPCTIQPDEVIDSLPGHLGWNKYETQPLSILPWSFAHFVNRHVSPGVRDWFGGKVLCRACVLELVGRRALNSLRELKAQHGPQLEDCWYGYRCRTQRKDAHAARLNHLCEPTRGN